MELFCAPSQNWFQIVDVKEEELQVNFLAGANILANRVHCAARTCSFSHARQSPSCMATRYDACG